MSAEQVAGKGWKMSCRKPLEVLVGELTHFSERARTASWTREERKCSN